MYVASEYEDKEDLSPPVTIPLKIKRQSACLGLLIDNAISITVQLCKLLIKHQDREKSRRCQINSGKRHEVQTVRLHMLKCCRKDKNYCGKHVDLGQPKSPGENLDQCRCSAWEIVSWRQLWGHKAWSTRKAETILTYDTLCSVSSGVKSLGLAENWILVFVDVAEH